MLPVADRSLDAATPRAPAPAAIRFPARTYGRRRRTWHGPAPTDARRWLLLAAWAGLWSLVLSWHGGYSWHYFSHGAALLLGGHPAGLTAPGGLHLYANYPQYQIGPLTFAVTALLAPLGLAGAQMVMLALGGVILWCGERLAVDATHANGRTRMLLAELAFVPLWTELAVNYSHLDDALALALSCAALTALARGRHRWVGPALGAAVAAKPWALLFLPLVWTLPRTARARALSWTLGIPAACWLPFILADPATITATGRFTIANAADSALRALGVTAARTPGWCRPAQLLLGVALGAVAVRRGRWPAVLLVGVAARLMLDPGTYSYYTAGAMAAALLLDLMRPTGRWPTASLTAFTGLYAVQLLGLPPAIRGDLRLLTCLTLILLALRSPASNRRPEGSSEPQRRLGCVSH